MERKTEITKDYVDRYSEELRQGKIGKRGLARKIVTENPEYFDGDPETAIENVRSSIRFFTHSHGKKKSPRGEQIRYDNMSELVRNAYRHLPESSSKERPVHELTYNKIGVMSDVHVPYHDEQAVMAGVNYFVEQGIDCLLLNGDTIDAWQISRFLKKGAKPDIFEEMVLTREFLYFLRHIFPEIPIIYKCGNHDVRIEDYMWAKAPEMAKLFELTMGHAGLLQQILHFEELKIQWVSDRQLIRAGNMLIVHGHEFGESVFSPVNPARGLWLRGKYNLLAGHFHQTSEHHEGNLSGEGFVTYSTGCFCNLSPSYRPFAYTKGNHGGAIVEITEDGNFSVDNFRITNGRVI